MVSEEQADTARERRRRDAARFYLRGRTQAEVAELLGVAQQTISRDLETVRAEWLASAKLDMDAIKARELAKLDAMEAELWGAWERSKVARKRTSRQHTEGGESQPVTVTDWLEDGIGDPRFLTGIESCMQRRARMLGLDAPKAVEIGVTPLKVIAGVDMGAV